MHYRLKLASQAKAQPRPDRSCSRESPEQFSDVLQKSQRLLSLLRASQGQYLNSDWIFMHWNSSFLNSSFLADELCLAESWWRCATEKLPIRTALPCSHGPDSNLYLFVLFVLWEPAWIQRSRLLEGSFLTVLTFLPSDLRLQSVLQKSFGSPQKQSVNVFIFYQPIVFMRSLVLNSH